MSAERIALCGVHVTSEHFVRGLLANGTAVDHIVTITEERAAANKVSGWFDYAPIAREHGIALHYAERYDLKASADREFFEKQRFDIIIQGGWQRLFPPEVLATLSIGAIGLHGSADFLPKGRGRSPMNWSLIEGRRRFLLHLFLIKPGVDDGDVIDIEDYDINEFDDIETLYMKLSIVNLRMHLRVLPRLAKGDIVPRPQAGTASYFPKRTAADGLIDWESSDVFEIHNLIRAQTRPYPGAFARLDGRLTRLWRAQPFDTRIIYPGRGYGEVVESFARGLVVNCRGGLLLVTDWEEMDAVPLD
jgi:methionyl-tRNA formyltransferase